MNQNDLEKINGGTDVQNNEGHDYCPKCQRLGTPYIEDIKERIRVWSCPDCGKLTQYM